jgi:16S rRNA (guanine527-N7)-methyltransferase
MTAAALLAGGIAGLEVPDPARVVALLRGYLAELERWNTRFGFVKANPEELVVKHALDSLSPWRMIEELARGSGAIPGGVLDVGSGSGFPGIPLAMALPGISFTLLERSAKKVSFLKTCAILFALQNVKVREATLASMTGDFAVVTFRAVAPLARLLAEAARADLRFDSVLAYKGRMDRAREEIDSIPPLSAAGFDFAVHRLEVPYMEGERCALIARAKRPEPSGGA